MLYLHCALPWKLDFGVGHDVTSDKSENLYGLFLCVL